MSNPSLPPDGEYSESFDAEILWLDGPGDTTIRPCRPERLEFLKALRARYLEAAAKAAENGHKDGDFLDTDFKVLVLDGPGDTTIRPPCRPERLEFLKALRARYLEAEAAKSPDAPENGQKS